MCESLFFVAIDPKGVQEIKRAQYIDLFDDPGNDLLPGYLKGADLLLLAEVLMMAVRCNSAVNLV